VKVSVGRRVGDRVEILQGLDAQADVVASGVGFLTDGDSVRVVKGQS
jgi:HlyD family secretion protein